MAVRGDRDPDRRLLKLVFRRLPETNYFEDDFKEDLRSLCEKLGLHSPSVSFGHFIEGKASKRRGPISSTAFITTNESNAMKLLKHFSTPDAAFIPPSRLAPSLDLDNPKPAVQVFYKQPEVSLALYPKTMKPKACRLNTSLVNPMTCYRNDKISSATLTKRTRCTRTSLPTSTGPRLR